MASNLKGYDCQFVDPPPNALICLICTNVARDPRQMRCCGKLFCLSCLEELRQHSNICPQCRKSIRSFPDKRSDRDVKSLKVQCDNSQNGCVWVGELRDLRNHLEGCGFTLLQCPSKCKSGDDIVKVLRKDMNRHKNDECPERQYQCPHCSETGKHKEMTTTHLETCPDYLVTCPNGGCNQEIKRRELSHHYQECPYENIQCKYVNIGCRKTTLRKDINEHESDTQQHLQIAVDTVNLQVEKLTQLQCTLTIQLAEMRSCLYHLSAERGRANNSVVQQQNSHGFVFKVTNFEAKKHDNRSIYGPPFYTCPGGYKMCISVYPNGDVEGRNKQISVYVYLMCGENDDHLHWPFLGSVMVELLNQLEDKNHYSKTLTFSSENEYSQRIVNAVRARKGWGYPCYIAHTLLGYAECENRQYLKDDCLFFRATVDARGPKPWLVAHGIA